MKAEPNTAPLLPPVELPKTPEAAPQKKCPTTPGMITVVCKPIIANMDSVPTKKLTKKPINTALGAYGKTIGTSNAGLESGTSFLAIPWNAGTISANTIRTP